MTDTAIVDGQSVPFTNVTVPYDVHCRINPDGTWFAAFQYRQIITVGGEVIKDQPLDPVPVDPGDAGQKALLTAFMGDALATALASNAALQARLDAQSGAGA